MLTALIILLIQADDFPPKHTDCKNDNDTCGNQNKIDFVEPRSFKETLSEVAEILQDLEYLAEVDL